jgi:putative endonuclease
MTPNTPDNRQTGRAGEDLASIHLEKLGYRIVMRNWRCRIGEIDIIAERDGELVFVEVKTRNSSRFGTAAEAVDWRKAARLRRLALAYLTMMKEPQDRVCRIELIAITRKEAGYEIEELEL